MSPWGADRSALLHSNPPKGSAMQMQNIKGPGFVMVASDDDFLKSLFERREVFFFTPMDEAGNVTGPEMHFDMTTMRKFLVGSCAPIVPATYQKSWRTTSSLCQGIVFASWAIVAL